MDLLIRSSFNGQKVLWQFPDDVGVALMHAFPETFSRYAKQASKTIVEFVCRAFESLPGAAICRRVTVDGAEKEEQVYQGAPWLARQNFNGECPEDVLQSYARAWRSPITIVSQKLAGEIAAWIEKGRPV